MKIIVCVGTLNRPARKHLTLIFAHSTTLQFEIRSKEAAEEAVSLVVKRGELPEGVTVQAATTRLTKKFKEVGAFYECWWRYRHEHDTPDP